MYTCIICRFPVELDDVTVPNADRTICLRCWHREVGGATFVSKALHRELSAVLGAVDK